MSEHSSNTMAGRHDDETGAPDRCFPTPTVVLLVGKCYVITVQVPILIVLVPAFDNPVRTSSLIDAIIIFVLPTPRTFSNVDNLPDQSPSWKECSYSLV